MLARFLDERYKVIFGEAETFNERGAQFGGPFGESSRVGLFTADAADDDGELVRVGRQSRRRSRLGLLSLLFGGDRFVRRDWNVLRAGGAGGQRQQNSCYDQIADHDLSQSFTFAQEPFAASQSDQQDEIDRHIPEV